MRKWLTIGGGMLLALVVVVHYARWQWNFHSADTHANSRTTENSHEICGIVASVYDDTRGNGHPTFIDLGHPYPDQTDTIVIWGDDLFNFNPPPASWQGERICVTGRVRLYRNVPEINVRRPDQIRVEK